MLRRHRQLRTQLHLLIDIVLFVIGFWLAHTLRDTLYHFFPTKVDPIAPFSKFFWLYPVMILLTPAALLASGFYNRPMLASRRVVLWNLFKGASYITVALIAVMFFFRTATDLARGVIVLFGFLSFLLVWLKEELFRYGLSSKFGQAQIQRRFILMGRNEETKNFEATLKDNRFEGIAVLAHIEMDDPLDRLANLLHEHSVNGVIILPEYRHMEAVERSIRVCEIEGVETWLMADHLRTQISRISLDDFYGRPVMVFRTAPELSWQAVAKNFLDFALALCLLFLLTPFLLLVALLIKLTSPGPALFRQERAGLNGQPFTMLKFRSMTSNAEQRKQELADLNEMSGPVFKVSNDPRITPLGRWLRRYSVDELPQLVNVLRGEMSIVGPRPLPVEEVKRFDDVAHRRRLSVRPGITCLWQVSGRNNVRDFNDWVRLDLEYIDNWSLWLDLKILFRTIPAVFSGAGAK